MSVEQYRLIDALRLAGARRLGRGWLYLREGLISPDLECVLVTDDDEELNERGLAIAAVQRGFTREGLDTDTLEDTFDCAKSFGDPPSDAAQQTVAAVERHVGPVGRCPMPRRHGPRPRLLAAVIRSNATLAFAAERQVVSQTCAAYIHLSACYC